MHFGITLFLGVVPLLTLGMEDLCDEMDCPDTQKCFTYSPVNADGRIRAVCVASIGEDVIVETDDPHINFIISCPDLQKIGLRYGANRIDCGPYHANVCTNDFECSGNHICCYDGCLKNCTIPVLSRYSP